MKYTLRDLFDLTLIVMFAIAVPAFLTYATIYVISTPTLWR